ISPTARTTTTSPTIAKNTPLRAIPATTAFLIESNTISGSIRLAPSARSAWLSPFAKVIAYPIATKLRFAARNAHTSLGSNCLGEIPQGSACPIMSITPAAVTSSTKQVFAIVLDSSQTCLARAISGWSSSGVASTVDPSMSNTGLEADSTSWTNHSSTACRASHATSMNPQYASGAAVVGDGAGVGAAASAGPLINAETSAAPNARRTNSPSALRQAVGTSGSYDALEDVHEDRREHRHAVPDGPVTQRFLGGLDLTWVSAGQDVADPAYGEEQRGQPDEQPDHRVPRVGDDLVERGGSQVGHRLGDSRDGQRGHRAAARPDQRGETTPDPARTCWNPDDGQR